MFFGSSKEITLNDSLLLHTFLKANVYLLQKLPTMLPNEIISQYSYSNNHSGCGTCVQRGQGLLRRPALFCCILDILTKRRSSPILGSLVLADKAPE